MPHGCEICLPRLLFHLTLAGKPHLLARIERA
jgi:hypothetical protein